MNDRLYNSGIDRLRSPERVERIEVERVADLCVADENFKSTLDIGTGSGIFAEAFYNRNLKVTGIDISPEMIETAKRILPDCEFKVAAAEELPFKDKSFDLVFFGVVFHEVSDFKKVLKESKRVAAKSVSILEWNYKAEEAGPPLEHRLKEEFIRGLSAEAGFKSLAVIQLKTLVLYKLSL